VTVSVYRMNLQVCAITVRIKQKCVIEKTFINRDGKKQKQRTIDVYRAKCSWTLNSVVPM